jgi:hypothetical protein
MRNLMWGSLLCGRSDWRQQTGTFEIDVQ